MDKHMDRLIDRHADSSILPKTVFLQGCKKNYLKEKDYPSPNFDLYNHTRAD